MKNIRVYKIRQKSNRKVNLDFVKKVFVLTFVFIGILLITNISNLNIINHIADIARYGKWLLAPNKLKQYLPEIKNNSLIWPFEEVVNRWIVDKWIRYENVKKMKWDQIPADYKIVFPWKVSDIMKKYKFLSLYNINLYILDPQLREKLVFIKRLFTASWTASYTCNESVCLRWIPDSGLHQWQDIVSVVGTPVRSISNWIVIQKKFNPKWFGNYLVVLSEIDGQLIGVLYWHLSRYATGIQEWTVVKQGQIIWYVGNTWRSKGPHLHLQINKLWKVNDISKLNLKTVADKLFYVRNHKLTFEEALSRIKQNTYNPVTFIESHLPIWNKQISSEVKLVKYDILKKEKKPFKIVKIFNPKISGKLTVWDSFDIILFTTWKDGKIVISTTNSLLQINPNTIVYKSWVNEYKINVLAVKPWDTKLIISDWYKTYQYYFSIYPKNLPKLLFIKLEGPSKLYYNLPVSYDVYPVDNLGNVGNVKFNGKFIVEVSKSKKTIYKKEYYVDTNMPYYKFKLKLNQYSWDAILKVTYISDDGKKFVTKKKLTFWMFVDYNKYNPWIVYLLKKGIIYWDSWFLYPQESLTKAQLVTILLRYKYWDKYKIWKKQYKEYLESTWKIFKDLPVNDFWAPYIYKAWKDWLIKWDKGYSFYNKPVNLFELIMIYWRFFNIKSYDPYVVWLNLSNNEEITPYAKAAKKYNLYPFKDLLYFKKDEIVTRENAFESLYRYIIFTQQNTWNLEENNESISNIHASSEALDETGNKVQLENLIKKLLK